MLVDGSGEAITLVFLGRRSIPGIRNGTQMVAEAMVGKHQGKLAMINPFYELLSVPEPSGLPLTGRDGVARGSPCRVSVGLR